MPKKNTDAKWSPLPLTSMAAGVKAAQEEMDMAVEFHEVWKPTLYDDDLRKRMGVSYATNAFHAVRAALRREVLLALMRLWDKDPRAVGVEAIAKTLREKSVIDTLAAERAARLGLPESIDQMRKDLGERADAAIALVNKYSLGGSHYDVRKKLQMLRNKHLAHRQISLGAATGSDATDEEIESFYQDNSKLVSLLLTVILATSYDPQDAAGVYRYYANHFWAGVRGERTEGHPSYRAPFELVKQPPKPSQP
jgi:AbiU2